MDKRINNGGARKGAGRKSKAAEQKLIELLIELKGKIGQIDELVGEE